MDQGNGPLWDELPFIPAPAYQRPLNTLVSRGVRSVYFEKMSVQSRVKVPNVDTDQAPEKVLVDIDSRMVAMEVRIH